MIFSNTVFKKCHIQKIFKLEEMQKCSNNVCPSCGNELHNGLCNKCGYVRIVFPEVVPEPIRQMESTRISVIKKLLDDNKESNELISSLNQDVESCREQNKQLKIEKDIVLKEKKTLELQVASLEKANEDIRCNSLSNERKLQLDISNLQSLLNQKENEVQLLSSELKNVKAELSDISTVSRNPLKGIVLLEDIRNDIRCMLPVFEGVNSYGSNPDKDMHHQIKFQVRGFIFKPVHFIIRTSTKGLILESFSGVNIFQNGRLVQSGVYARQSDNFILDDRIRLNISQI